MNTIPVCFCRSALCWFSLCFSNFCVDFEFSIIAFVSCCLIPSCLTSKWVVSLSDYGKFTHENSIYCPQTHEPSGLFGGSVLPFTAWVCAFVLLHHIYNCTFTLYSTFTREVSRQNLEDVSRGEKTERGNKTWLTIIPATQMDRQRQRCDVISRGLVIHLLSFPHHKKAPFSEDSWFQLFTFGSFSRF